MKTYKEVADSVLERRDKYLAEQKRKRAVMFRTFSSLAGVAAAAIVGLIVVNNQLFSDIKPSPENDDYNLPDIETVTISPLVIFS